MRCLALSRSLLLAVLSGGLCLTSVAGTERCADPGAFPPSDPIHLDLSRLAGTSEHAAKTTRSRIQVDIAVSGPDDSDLSRAVRVELIDPAGRFGAIQAEATGERSRWTASVVPGMYTIRVTIQDDAPAALRGLRAPEVRSLLDQDVNKLRLRLAPAGQPFFRMGRGLIPFRPSPYVAIVTRSAAQANALRPLISGILQPLDARLLSVEAPEMPRSAQRSVILVRSANVVFDAGIERLLRTRLQDGIRVGQAIDLGRDSLRVLDNRYVLRFHPRTREDAEWQRRVLSQTGMTLVKRFRRDPDLVVVSFTRGSYLEHLATVECLIAEEALITGEPDLIQGWETTEAIPTGWPNDPRYADQNNAAVHAPHHSQQIREAWELLVDSTREQVAKSSVHVGLIDKPIDPADEDLACLVDGKPQIETCWDATRLDKCSGPLLVDRGHGMRMAGIIAACANNGKGVTGIAPGVRINAVGLEMVRDIQYYASHAYSDLLLWMGGVGECDGNETPEHPCRWPQVQSAVISNSYTIPTWEGWNNELVPLPELVGYAFHVLVTHGRNGKGTILVYAAGNRPPPFATEMIAPMAADPRTIGVSNCYHDGVKEKLYRGREGGASPSNIGEKVDVCARGENAETIAGGCLGDPPPCRSNGTSAATATVSGIVALMLSAKEDLTWQQVRQILRSCADKIDRFPDEPEGNWGTDGRSRWYGSGRVNAAKAVKASLECTPERCACVD